MAARPRLLFLSQVLPYPPSMGVTARIFNLLRVLAKSFDVTALCFHRSHGGLSGYDMAAGVDVLSRFVRVEAFPLPQDRSRARLLADHARAALFRRPFTHYAYASRAFDGRLDALLREEAFDLAVLESLDLARLLPRLSSLPVACTHHNVESELLARRAEHEGGALVRRHLRAQARLVEREEARECGRVALNVTVSERDRDTLSRLAPAGRFLVVPNGVDVDYFRPQGPADGGVVFVGGTTWFPNLDALEFFAGQVLPHLQGPGGRGDVPRIRWVGPSRDADRVRFASHGIELTGYLEDIRPEVGSAACFVVPLRIGGGTRLKILDAWAMGKAVVSTSVGCEGLRAVDGENLLIRDDPAGFADAVRRVLGDAELRARLGRAGRATAERDYSWEALGGELSRAYLALAEEARGG